ncbi:MAG: Si-specific NAD(P)(+) transhydrogenase [Planctomycetes bacterium]|nr:Si-specific NAD(P)(+) transhydrogenase [Planctomycetota bacterium]
MPSYDYDLAVLGSGPAGSMAAVEGGRRGKRVALIERARDLGGAGINTGTLPSKTLRESALHLSGFDQRGLDGVDLGLSREQISVAQFLARERHVIENELALLTDLLHSLGVVTLRGSASFLDAHTLALDGERRVTAEKILIATGSRPRHPPGFPFEDPDVVDSDTILELERIPDTLTVVGGGVIGCEYASVFACLGVKVTLLESHPRLMGFLDDEVYALLERRFRAMGIELLFEDEVLRVVDVPGPGVAVETRAGKRFAAGKLLVAAGRESNVEGLGLEKIGVEVDARGRIQVDANFQTRVPGVYAAGDLLGFPALASTGMEQGRLAVCHAFGDAQACMRYETLPYGLYTIPEVGYVGLSEEQCRAQKLDYLVGRAHYRDNARGQIVGDLDGLLKLIFRPADRVLLGVHVLGEKATELVHLGQMVMQLRGTLETLAHTVFNFPTLSVLYKRAAFDGLATLERRVRA